MNSHEQDNQISQLSIDLRNAASRWEAALQMVARATESTVNKVLGESSLLRDAFAKDVADGLGSITDKVQESEDVILAHLRRRSPPSSSHLNPSEHNYCAVCLWTSPLLTGKFYFSI